MAFTDPMNIKQIVLWMCQLSSEWRSRICFESNQTLSEPEFMGTFCVIFFPAEVLSESVLRAPTVRLRMAATVSDSLSKYG